jgi:hypothetical protein
VRFEGDVVIAPSGFFGGVGIPMATAVLRRYTTADGFLIAADGLMQDADGTVTSRSTRKIFPFGSDGRMAYSLAGRVGIGPDEGAEISFRFRTAIDAAVQAIPASPYETLAEYADQLAEHVRSSLEETCQPDKIGFDYSQRPNPGERGRTIAWAFLDGYYKGLESSLTIRFYEHDGRFQKGVFPQLLVPGKFFYHGSTRIHDLLEQNDSRFCTGQFLRPLEVPVPHLSEETRRGIIYCRVYIEACESDEGRKEDPFCKTIGGDIHMAVITASKGFEWVPGFKPKN